MSQYGIVAAIVAAAVAYLFLQLRRRWTRAKTGCGGDCGCESSATPNLGERKELVQLGIKSDGRKDSPIGPRPSS